MEFVLNYIAMPNEQTETLIELVPGFILHIGSYFEKIDGKPLKDHYMVVVLKVIGKEAFFGFRGKQNMIPMILANPNNFYYGNAEGNTIEGYVKFHQVYVVIKKAYIEKCSTITDFRSTGRSTIEHG